MKALVLTGRILAGSDEQQVWAKVAAMFKLDADAFGTRILSRLPLSVRETEDDAQLQKMGFALLQAGAEIVQTEADGKWFVQQAGRVAGPVPLTYLKAEHQAQRLAGDVKVKQTTDKDWVTLALAIGEPDFTLDEPPTVEESTEGDEPPPLPINKVGKNLTESRRNDTPTQKQSDLSNGSKQIEKTNNPHGIRYMRHWEPSLYF